MIIMKKEKCGFIYLWRDKKYNRYYIGSHWGTEDDGYICSSKWMRNSYDKRPQDFKRRIVQYVQNREDLYDVENQWLSMIKKEEVKVRYYNLNLIANHWTAYPENVKTIREKISHKVKEAMQRPEVREKYEQGLKNRDNKSSDLDVREKRRQSMIETMSVKFPEENRWKKLTEEERKKYYSDKAKKMHANRSDEQRKEIGRKLSEANKRNKRENVTCPHCKKTGNPIVMPRWHFDNCKLNNINT